MSHVSYSTYLVQFHKVSNFMPLLHLLHLSCEYQPHEYYIILSNNLADHVESRCKSARKAFYALQRAGLCKNGAGPCTIAHIYNVAIKPVLTYGCAAVGLSDKHVTDLEKLQGSLIKAALDYRNFADIQI